MDYSQPPRNDYYSQLQNQQMSSDLNNAILKGQLEIEKAVAKEHYLNCERLNLFQQKVQLNEQRKELSKARYEQIICREDGSFNLVVNNPYVKMPNREIVNFQFVNASELRSSDGDSGIFMLCLRIGGEERSAFINQEKLGNINYVMKKIRAIGGQIFTDSRKTVETFGIGFCNFLMNCNKETFTIPTHVGWIKEGIRQYKFVEEGTRLWAEIEKKTK